MPRLPYEYSKDRLFDTDLMEGVSSRSRCYEKRCLKVKYTHPSSSFPPHTLRRGHDNLLTEPPPSSWNGKPTEASNQTQNTMHAHMKISSQEPLAPSAGYPEILCYPRIV